MNHYVEVRDDAPFELSADGTIQLGIIEDVARLLARLGVGCWLFGGWGLDVRLGRITREHEDIEFWVERCDGKKAEEALIAGGYAFLDTQPVEEAREFTKSGITCSFALFDRGSDGRYRTQGRWSDWVFPPGSFPDIPARLGDVLVGTMSAEGMLEMKEQFSQLRNGKPLREKDARDLMLLRGLVSRSTSTNISPSPGIAHRASD
jgi:lincosamide nucleotidyltransferase A/C/D/E